MTAKKFTPQQLRDGARDVGRLLESKTGETVVINGCIIVNQSLLQIAHKVIIEAAVQ
jgi:hypothetical protein